MSDNKTLELALRDEPQAVMLTNQQLIVIANTDFVPKGLRGNVPACLACVARGRAMGIPDMVALNGIAIINGKATLSAELMVAIVREHGHSITGDVTMKKAWVKGRRRDNGDTMTAEFNEQMAIDAGLAKKDTWQKYPDDMMWARAVSKLCRRLFADCFAGGTYTKEEIEDGENELTADEVLDEPPPERPAPVDVIVPEMEIALGETEPDQMHLEDAPADDGLAEPEEAEPDGSLGTEPAPARNVAADSGSVSPWQQLKIIAHDAGLYDQLLATAKEKFPGRTANGLTEDECAELWGLVEMVNA